MTNVIQTFFVNPAAVNGAEFIAVTSVDLFFESKPSTAATASGVLNPGVTVQLCEVVNDSPRPDRSFEQIARVLYDGVSPSSDSNSITTFAFSNPVVIETNRYYGIVVSMDDPGFSLWSHVAGDRTVGTNVVSTNVTDNRDGKYYQYSSGVPSLVVDAALKFGVNIAKFDSEAAELTLTNQGYEFLTFTSNDGSFSPGEKVFANTSNLTGTAALTTGSKTVVGTGTSFTDLVEEQTIVFKSGSNTFLRQVEYIISDTELTLFEPAPLANTAANFAVGIVGTVQRVNYNTNQLILNNSNASATNKFIVGHLLTGEQTQATAEIASIDDYEVDEILANLDVKVGGDSTYTPTFKVVKKVDSDYVDDDIEQPLPNQTEVVVDTKSVVASRSTEVGNTAIFDDGSLAVVMNISSSNPFAAPIVDLNKSTIILTSEVISDVYQGTFANTTVYDSEVFNAGNAVNKHITQKMSFSEGRVAEDLKVYLSGYRPKGTQLRVYGKFRGGGDGEPFDDKLWTPLTETGENTGVFSSTINRNDYIEMEFSVPSVPQSIETLGGSFTTAEGSNLVSSSSGFDPSAYLDVGMFIKVYNELFPSNFMVATVTAVNSTTVTLSENVTLDGIVGTGQKIDILFYGRTAYLNASNDNVMRYLDQAGGVHDGFVEAQVKIVFLGDPEQRISPKVDQLEMIGVSA